MKKRNLMPTVKKTAKSAFALSLAATMVVPAGASVAAAEETADDAVTVPKPIKVYDFEDGLQELYNEDDNFSITKTEQLYFQKTPEEVGKTEKVDANGLVYVGSGTETRYHKGTISNQPTTAYDEEKGTVLKIGKSQVIPAVYKTKSAGVLKADGTPDTQGTEALDSAVPYESSDAAVSGQGVLIQDEYIANSEIVISNPYGDAELAASLVERSEFDVPDDTWKRYRGNRYQPIWEKGLTLSYWIKVPSDENGEYLPSSVLRWELLNQEYYQADDYAKYLACAFFDEEKTEKYMNYTEEDYANAAKQESKVIYGSEYYFKYVETDGVDEDGAPKAKLYRGSAGFAGPVYDSRYFNKTEGYEQSWYYAYNPNFIRGYTVLADGTYEAQLAELCGGTTNYYANYSTLDMEKGSYVRRADVDGELQIDVDNSIFWVPDNNQGINKNYNVKSSYGIKAGMQNGDVFFMNSWQEGQKPDAAGNGTYQSAKAVALSPVTSITDYNEEDGSYVGVKNGNCDTWHQVTLTLQNDWVEFYVDGIKTDVDNNYSSRGGISIDSTESFKRLNKGTGLRYCYGAEKGAVNFAYGNYVCRLLMDWITDEDATLHIGGAGQYAPQYAQATHSNEFSLDDLKFYGELLTEEQIKTAYNNEVAEMNKTADVTGAAVLDLTAVSDTSVNVENAVQNTTVTINGKDVTAVTVAGNAKTTTSTAAKAANPFAGKDLEGATIGYWVKQDDAERSAVLSFVDEEKEVHNPKGTDEDAQSILYVQNDGTSVFYEGYSNTAVGESLKNTYTTTTDATTAGVMLADSTNWNYITITMTNAGIKYYENGKLVENKASYPTGVRFLDGYYQRLADEADVETRFGAFGGTDNQCASTLMKFITGEDTAIYFNYMPNKGGMGCVKTSGASYAAVKTVDAALTDAEVQKLYESSLAFDPNPNPNPNPDPEVMKGDVDGNSKVELADAQAALKIALKIVTATEEQLLAGDIDENGKVELNDAQAILKEALKITTNWK